MRGKPKLVERIEKRYSGVSFDIIFPDNLTIVAGDSSNGKSFLWQFLDDLKALDEYSYIITYNYKDIKKSIGDSILHETNKLFAIDNADILLGSTLREHIAFDFRNQYLIFGRDPSGLMLLRNNMATINFDKETKTLRMKSL